MHKWDESIRIAEKKNHSDVSDLKKNYFEWLKDTGQEEKAAETKEREGNYKEAIDLYLKGGLPARAANVVNHHQANYQPELLEKIAGALKGAGMFDKAGQFFERMEMPKRAMEAYIKGHAYRKAVDLARKSFPAQITRLEEEWGDHLVNHKQTESAIPHFIEANCFKKAIDAAISSRQWNKAIQLVSSQPTDVAKPFLKQIAKHFAEIRQFDQAEK